MNRRNITHGNISAVSRTIPIIVDRPDGIHVEYTINAGASVARAMNSYPNSPDVIEELQRMDSRLRLDDFSKHYGYAGMTCERRAEIRRAITWMRGMLEEVA